MKLKKVLKYIKYKSKIRKNIKQVTWEHATDIKKRLKKLLYLSSLPFKIENISTLRSHNSKARAYARIWGLSKVWQIALNVTPHYVIEVLSERYDNLTNEKKDEILLHELAHIPNNFSGSLIPHIRYGKRSFRNKVDKLILSVKLNSNK